MRFLFYVIHLRRKIIIFSKPRNFILFRLFLSFFPCFFRLSTLIDKYWFPLGWAIGYIEKRLITHVMRILGLQHLSDVPMAIYCPKKLLVQSVSMFLRAFGYFFLKVLMLLNEMIYQAAKCFILIHSPVKYATRSFWKLHRMRVALGAQ